MNALGVYIGDLEMPSIPPLEFFEQDIQLLQKYSAVAFMQVEVNATEPSAAAISTNTVYGFMGDMIQEPLVRKSPVTSIPLSIRVPQVILAAAVSQINIAKFP
jgi:hypothetical protein